MKPDSTILEYKTKDLGEAAALLCESSQLLRLEQDQNFSWFVFSNQNNCRNLSNHYWFGNLTVNARSYQEALRTLKDRLFLDRR
jgi:hypothetical protein